MPERIKTHIVSAESGTMAKHLIRRGNGESVLGPNSLPIGIRREPIRIKIGNADVLCERLRFGFFFPASADTSYGATKEPTRLPKSENASATVSVASAVSVNS